jgi:hypothetical protein
MWNAVQLAECIPAMRAAWVLARCSQVLDQCSKRFGVWMDRSRKSKKFVEKQGIEPWTSTCIPAMRAAWVLARCSQVLDQCSKFRALVHTRPVVLIGETGRLRIYRELHRIPHIVRFASGSGCGWTGHEKAKSLWRSRELYIVVHDKKNISAFIGWLGK